MADELERRVRALTPHLGTYVELPTGERLGVRRAGLAPTAELEPGELAAREDRLLYGVAAGALELIEVQPEGKRPMRAADWLRGHRELLAGG
jgi:methionyl-tRNA formyltransferase